MAEHLLGLPIKHRFKDIKKRDHALLTNVLPDQHHAKLHQADHVGEGVDAIVDLLASQVLLYGTTRLDAWRHTKDLTKFDARRIYDGSLEGKKCNLDFLRDVICRTGPYASIMNYSWYWDSLDGYTKTLTGSGTVTAGVGRLILDTGATLGSTSQILSTLNFVRYQYYHRIWYYFCLNRVTDVEAWITNIDASAPNTTASQFGVYIENDSLYAYVADGTNFTKVFLDTIAPWTDRSVTIEYTPPIIDGSVKFYVNGVLKATITTNIPTYHMYRLIYVKNNVAAIRRLFIEGFYHHQHYTV